MGWIARELEIVHKAHNLGNDQFTTIEVPVMNHITMIIKIGRFFLVIEPRSTLRQVKSIGGY